MTVKAALVFAALSTALAQQQPGQGVNFYSVEKETHFGDQLTAKMQSATNAQPDARLESIGDKLAANATGAYHYRFYIYTASDAPIEPVAFPGGPIFMAQNLASSDDAQVTAMLAHIALRTYTREQTQIDLMQIGRQSAQIANPNVNLDPDLPGGMRVSELQIAAIKQRGEARADAYAATLLTAAGYDPKSLIRWLQSLPRPDRASALEKALAVH